MKARSDNYLWEIFKSAFAVSAGLSTAGAITYSAYKILRHGIKSLSLESAMADLRGLRDRVRPSSGIVEIIDEKNEE